MVTLRYLAKGENHRTLSLYFMIGRPTISKCIQKVMKAIIAHVGPIHAKVPSSESAWLEVEQRFANRWDYVTVSSKHVMMKPRNSAFTYFIYKRLFSINLIKFNKNGQTD